MASRITDGVTINSFDPTAVATVGVPSDLASLCARRNGIADKRVSGTFTVGATCGPGSGPFTIYPISPGTLCGEKYDPYEITTGPDGALWFTAQGGVGRISTSGAVSLYPAPTGGSSSIVAGPDGALWIAGMTVSGGSAEICRMTTSGVVTNCYGVSALFEYPGQITAGPDGALWFAGAGGGAVGRITTSGAVSYYGSRSLITTGITTGPDGNLWFTALGSGGVIGHITTAGAITTYPVPLVSSTITPGPDGSLWFLAGPSGDTVDRITTSGVVTTVVVDPAISTWTLTAGPDG
ncbi:MAG: hypothetical protein ABSG81_09660, partial [Acidimicrobiales bacterium]